MRFSSEYATRSTEDFEWEIASVCIYVKLTLYYGWQSLRVVLPKITVEQFIIQQIEHYKP